MRFIVEQYDPIWATQFQDIKRDLEKTLKDVDFVSIEHVGSTSVPGLAAKPVLDIDVVVTPENLESAKRALVDNGYTYRGDWGIPGRYVFRKANETPTRNLYVCIEGCQSLRNHLLLRDICRQDKSLREAYGRKKQELAQMDWADAGAYCEAKMI